MFLRTFSSGTLIPEVKVESGLVKKKIVSIIKEAEVPKLFQIVGTSTKKLLFLILLP